MAIPTNGSNVIFGFKSRIDMKPIPNERDVYEILKENIVKPAKSFINKVKESIDVKVPRRK